MDLNLGYQRLRGSLGIGLLAVGALAVAVPASAQETGGRMRVLVPSLEPQAGADKKFGEKTADELRDFINEMNTHAPVEEKDVKQALKKFKLKEEELSCIQWRQLAVQVGAELVMCGAYESGAGGMQVSGRFVNSKTGEVFEVAPFAAAEPKAAAQKIQQVFEAFVDQIRLTTFCVDYYNSQQYEQALEACDNSLAINGQSQTALFAKAQVLQAMERHTEALDLIRKILEVNPAHNNALLVGGIVAAKAGQQQLGRQYFVQYLELNPGDVNVRLKMASDLKDAGDPEGALRLVEAGFAQDSTDANLLTFAGHFAMLAGKQRQDQAAADNGAAGDPKEMYDTALGYYQTVHAAQGAETSVDVIRNMRIAFSLLDRDDEAVAVAKQAVDAKPADVELWVIYADALKDAGQYAEAVTALDKVAELKPDYEGLNGKRAVVLMAAGKAEEAKAAFQTAIANGVIEAQQVATLIFAEGYNKYQAKQYDTALDLFALSKDFATDDKMKAQANFFGGVIYFQRASEAHKPQTLASAKASLPLFQRALEFFQSSTAYAEQAQAINQYIDTIRKYVEYEKAVIERG